MSLLHLVIVSNSPPIQSLMYGIVAWLLVTYMAMALIFVNEVIAYHPD